jgi:hypothetical protein
MTRLGTLAAVHLADRPAIEAISRNTYAVLLYRADLKILGRIPQ